MLSLTDLWLQDLAATGVSTEFLEEVRPGLRHMLDLQPAEQVRVLAAVRALCARQAATEARTQGLASDRSADNQRGSSR